MTHISIPVEVELNTHACYVGRTHVCPVHETDAVHGTDSYNKSTVNTPDDLALLLGCKFIVGINLAHFVVDIILGGVDMSVLDGLLLLVYIVTVGGSSPLHGWEPVSRASVCMQGGGLTVAGENTIYSFL